MKKLSLLMLTMTLSLLTSATGLYAQNSDVIHHINDIGKVERVRGVITKMTATEVTITVNTLDRKHEVNRIDQIELGESPAPLKAALSLLEQGQLEAAKVQLDKPTMVAATIKNKYVKQEVLYAQAICAAKLAQGGQGDITKAGSLLQGFVTGGQDSYRYFEAVELLGDLFTGIGEYKFAAENYGKLKSAPWLDYQLRGSVLQANALIGSEQYPQALSSYEAAIKAAPKTPAGRLQKTLAQVGKARCLAETGKAQEGIKLLRDVLKESDPKQNPQLFGRAYNALGACYRKDNKPQDALLAYLHTDLLFYSDPPVHAEALYYLKQLWTTVKKSDRANRARTLLQQRYASSVWATKE
ncbi:MAG TPA: tetratricopeptide repeat protein [Planctomycetes bacterium]|nr:tetratricopeptide repeat protein [Planctomycetaceae bacterium]HIN94968.1 tetratricopeptide repeat protein [Planctomycetota bacterium]